MKLHRPMLAWAFYDWANSAFATTVMAGFFPIFFKQYWSTDSAAQSTFWLGVANSAAAACVFLLSPLLGALADRSAQRKSYLMTAAFFGACLAASLSLVPHGAWPLAATIYALATVCFLGGNTFYDSLLSAVSTRPEREFVSALGYALGYLGGGLLFAVNVAMTIKPAWFGLTSASDAVRWSFATVGAWWIIFSAPIFLFVRETPPAVATPPFAKRLKLAVADVRATLRDISQRRDVWLFLVAYWCYIDGVDTIVVMAIDYGLSLGLQTNALITALLITQFVGLPAALAFGKLGERFGAKAGIFVAIGVYTGVIVYATQIHSEREFMILAAVIGLVQGGIQSLSRALFSCMIPTDRAAQYFGFYNLLGKFAAIIGPSLVGVVTVTTGSSRFGMLSIAALFFIGAICLYPVNTTKSRIPGADQ